MASNSDLPVCRLCKKLPRKNRSNNVYCSDDLCSVSHSVFTEGEWRRLMHVPERKSYKEGTCVMKDIVRVRGYNEALDDLEKGGL